MNEIVPTIHKAVLAKSHEPIRAQQNRKGEVLTIHAPLHDLKLNKQVESLSQASKMADESNLANSKISKVYIQAN